MDCQSPWLPRAPPVSLLGTPLYHGTRVLPIGFPTPKTKDFFLPWPSAAAKGRGFLPGRYLGERNIIPCFCSGRDLGEKEKKVHQGRRVLVRTLLLPYTGLFHLHNQSKLPHYPAALSASILSLFLPFNGSFLRRVADPRFYCFLLTQYATSWVQARVSCS